MLFVLVPATTLVTPQDLYVLARKVEIGARHCAKVWGLEAPAIEVFQSTARLPAFCSPIVFYENAADAAGALADHAWDPIRHMPAARVFVGPASGLFDGQFSLSEATSHEVLEAIVDPRCDLWTSLPGRPGVEVAYEVGDPVQDDYPVDGAPVSNFVTPAFFRDDLADPAAAESFRAAGGKFDWKGTLSRAGEIGPEGYLILRSPTRRWTETLAGEMGARAKPGAADPLARTQRRLAA